jgi:hypothetical protein
LFKTELGETTVRAVPEAAAGMAKGGKGGGVGPRTAFLANRADALAQPLTYEFTTERMLRIVPAQAGTLQVTVGTETIFAKNPVIERTPITLSIPAGAVSVRIEFTPPTGPPYIVTPSVPQQ